MPDHFAKQTHHILKGVSAYREDRGTNPRSTKLATFTATLNLGVAIKNVILHGNANKNWITWPSAEYLKPGGGVGFLPIFEFDEPIKQQLESELFAALRAMNIHIHNEGL